MNGKLIVIEGLDGSGKQTQTQILFSRFVKEGTKVDAVSFPDYAEPSSALVKQYLGGEFGSAGEVSAYAASSFYAVDRFASYQKYWKEDYLSGYTILADRYATSNLIHQMCKLPKEEWESFYTWMEDFEYGKLGLPRPDGVVYLDMYPKVSKKLLSERYGGDERKKDIHESDEHYQEQCRDCALYAVEHFGWTLVACSDEEQPFEIEAIAQQIYTQVQLILSK